jgi:hypothetical protein
MCRAISTGGLLMGFLDFYGNRFDPRTTALSLARNRGAGCYFARAAGGYDPLFIEDPLAPANNVGRNCFRIYQVGSSIGARRGPTNAFTNRRCLTFMLPITDQSIDPPCRSLSPVAVR